MSTGPLPCTFPSLQLTTLYHIRQLCKRGTPGYLSFSHRRGPCGCNTSVPMPVSVRYRPGRDCRRAHESTGLYLGALAPHLLEGCLVPSRPFLMRKVGVHGWVPAPWWPLAAWATSLCAAHSGMDRAARGKQYPAGAAYCPLGSWGVAAPGPAGSTQALPPLTQTPGYRLP